MQQLAWIIHKRRDMACEAVVVHREQAITMQIGLPKG
jgi:hypothetical protein